MKESPTSDYISSMEEILKNVKNKENPDLLTNYKKIFKSTIPFTMRGWVSAFLLKEYLSDPKRKRLPDGKSLFVGVGKNRKVYPKDLIQLIVGTGHVTRDEIGEIKILDNYSFVTVHPDSAEKIIDSLDGDLYRGRKLTVNFARKKN